MLINKYYFESKDRGVMAIIGYNTEGVMCYYDATQLSPSASTRFLNILPYKESLIPEFRKNTPYLEVTKVQTDLSFKAFYDAYAHKVGKKALAEKKWNKLSDAEKLACFKALPHYNRYLESTRIAKAYLETFLNNNYWENEYK
jgi:hypothetical protein